DQGRVARVADRPANPDARLPVLGQGLRRLSPALEVLQEERREPARTTRAPASARGQVPGCSTLAAELEVRRLPQTASGDRAPYRPAGAARHPSGPLLRPPQDALPGPA